MKIKIKLHPNSSQEKIKKLSDEKFEVWIKEKPLENKANLALENLMKKNFKKSAKVIKGLKSRNKIIEIK